MSLFKKIFIPVILITILMIGVSSAKLHPGIFGGVSLRGATFGWIGGEMLFPMIQDQIKIDLGGETAIGFASGAFAWRAGPQMKLYFLPNKINVLEPNFTVGGGIGIVHVEDETNFGGFLRADFGVDFMLKNSSITPFMNAGLLALFGEGSYTQFQLLGGIRF
jgi:hypothetical protein